MDAIITETARLFGVKVFESRYVPEGKVFVIGRGDEPEMPLPLGWDTMTDDAKEAARAKWTLAHGGSLMVHDLRSFREASHG